MGRIIAAIRSQNDLAPALTSPVEEIFLLASDILSLRHACSEIHAVEKKVFVHIDFTEGLGRDATALKFLAGLKPDGIISTRVNLIKQAHEAGLKTVQRFFIIDSHSLDTAAEAARTAKPDMVELMPGVIPRIIEDFKRRTSLPLIAGGLIDRKQDVTDALRAGAHAVSTSKKELWSIISDEII